MPTPQTRSHKRQRGIEPISTSEARALLAACNRGTTGLRAKALVLIMWRAGLRVGEALALLPRDVETDHGIVRVREGKTGSRVVPLDPEACAELGRWMDRRKALGATGHDPLFCTVSPPGGALEQTSVRRLLRRLAQKAGLEKRVYPHVLRHSYAQDLALEGQPLVVIQQALGHRHAATTSEYLHAIAPTALLSALRAWPSWSLDPDELTQPA